MKKAVLFNWSLLIGCLIGLSGCKSAYQSTYVNAPVCLAYSSEKGVIKEQSQISTIVLSNNYGLVIDNINVVSTSGKFNKDLRTANDGNFKSARIIDVLPGEHVLEVTFSNLSSSMGSPVLSGTRKPIVETVRLEAGEIYTLELKILDMAAQLMMLKKVNSGSTSSDLVLKPLPDKYRQYVIDNRNKQSF